MLRQLLLVCFTATLAAACGQGKKERYAADAASVVTPSGEQVALPAPYDTRSAIHFSKVVGWGSAMPVAPAGFSVSKFAGGLRNPRWIYVAPNGDIFVSEATAAEHGVNRLFSKIIGKAASEGDPESANRITVFRDTDHDGVPDIRATFLEGLHQPFGMAILGNHFYVGDNDALLVFDYTPGALRANGPGRKLVDLPAGKHNRHWTKNVFAGRNGKLYVTVGSGSNVAEHGLDNEVRRANILELNPDGSGERIFASGLRNPEGLGYAPGTSTLWTSVNERDELGDNLVPDYLTSVQEGGFYGWPFSYWGSHADPRMKDDPHPSLVAKAIVPDVDLGPHTASLGLAFDEKNQLPAPYTGGAFIGQHGSWNRSVLSGYQVAFVPFSNGKPSGAMQSFLTGFIADSASRKVHGRPVGVAFTSNGDMLVADDAGNTIWRVSVARNGSK